MTKAIAVGLVATTLCGNLAWAENRVTPTERGAVAETDRYRAEFRDGVLASFFNKLTGEEYLDRAANMDAILPHLPGGLGTQHAPEEREAARKLFDSPWGEQPPTSTWPNQHYADGKSVPAITVDGMTATLNYTGLTDGTRRFDDETFSLTIEIDAETGDLLVTPAAEAPREGVYGVGFAAASLAPAVTVEAPIFEGVRLDRHMLPKLWINFWGSFWDYSFLALNGEATGAVGLWCQDKETRIHKTLFYLVDGKRLTLSVQAMNIPPFNQHRSANPMTWRLQAFDKGWWQAVGRFRDWRQKNIKFAPRPEWARQICFMITGTQGAGGVHIIPYIQTIYPDIYPNRVLAWLPDVRRAGFDKNHADNTPYPTFEEDLKLYHDVGMKTMTYLIPTIMWSADAKSEREKQGVRLSREAYTSSPFQEGDKVVHRYYDQNHLGHAGWQRWMLDWVKEYIQHYGTDGIYHDQSYFAPIDNRGLINGMTSPQGYADYFYKAATENPNSIHATEHLTEINISGASIGLGCGIHWGTPGYNVNDRIGPLGSMGWQRIKRASPVCNALHYPHGAIVAFPHMSSFGNGRARFNHGMDQVERRGDFPGANLYDHFGGRFLLHGVPGNRDRKLLVPFDKWANGLWLARQRQWLFLKYRLRASFPEDWHRHVLTYFTGANGEDFRYEEFPWGTAFVQIKDGKRIVHYARVQGVSRAPGAGGILGWPCYDSEGSAGLDPEVVYVVDGSLGRPPAWFTLPEHAAVTVRDGYADKTMAWMELAPAAGAETGPLSLLLTAGRQPVAVWVDGKLVKAAKAGRQWRIPARGDSFVAVLFAEPQSGFDAVAENRPLTRIVEIATRRDLFRPEFFSADLAQKHTGLTIGQERRKNGFNPRPAEYQTFIPIKAPAADGVLRIVQTAIGKPPNKTTPVAVEWRINGRLVQPANTGVKLPLKASEMALLSVSATVDITCTFEWQ